MTSEFYCLISPARSDRGPDRAREQVWWSIHASYAGFAQTLWSEAEQTIGTTALMPGCPLVEPALHALVLPKLCCVVFCWSPAGAPFHVSAHNITNVAQHNNNNHNRRIANHFELVPGSEFGACLRSSI